MNDSHVQKVDKFSGNSWTTKRLINCTSTCLNIAPDTFLWRKFYIILYLNLEYRTKKLII